MKITFYSYVFPLPNAGFNPGIERVIGELAPAIASYGHEVTVISSYRNGAGPSEEFVHSVRLLRVRDLRARLGKIASIGSADFASLYLRSEAKFGDLFHDSDVVHAFAPVCRWPFSTPLVSHFHHYDAPKRLVEYTYAISARRMWSLTYKKSACVVAVSAHSAREFAEAYPHVHTRVQVVHNGVNVQKFGSRRLSNDRNRRLLFVGPLIARKGLQHLLLAFARVADQLDLYLDIVGTGNQHGYLARLATDLKIEDRVLFHGFIDDEALVHLYHSSCAFVFPSLHEGFGLVVAEAMAAGLPVIANNSTALPEVVGDAGILVAPADVEELSHAIWRICTDECLRLKLSNLAHLRASTKFSWGSVAKKMLHLYASLTTLR